MSEKPEKPAGDDPYRAGFERIDQVIVTTGNEVAGYEIVSYLAIVRGIVVRATSIGKGIVGSFKALAGGRHRREADPAASLSDVYSVSATRCFALRSDR